MLAFVNEELSFYDGDVSVWHILLDSLVLEVHFFGLEVEEEGLNKHPLEKIRLIAEQKNMKERDIPPKLIEKNRFFLEEPNVDDM